MRTLARRNDNEPLLLLMLLFCLAGSFSLTVSKGNKHRVLVVGGTHGNEYTGVWVVQSLNATMASLSYPHLHIDTLLSHPEAISQNRRFLQTDLNREFAMEKLRDDSRNSIEAKRAKELHALLGPKDSPQYDIIVDLHSTTTNMGLTLIIPEGDVLMGQAAAYVQSQMKTTQTKTNILLHKYGHSRLDRPNLGSLGEHGFTIEVGPVPQGVLRHDAVQTTQTALYHLLDFCQAHYRANNPGGDNDDTEKKAFETLVSTLPPIVPCFRSAPAVMPGELSGKITWPTDERFPNFPQYMIHESVQDKDFAPIHVGDPLFVDPHGNVIPYQGSHGETVYLMFVNEGGYYYASSGTGIGVATVACYHRSTAHFCDCGDGHDEQCDPNQDEACALE